MQLRRTELSDEITSQSTDFSSYSYIIDNTFYPCYNGSYQPELYLLEVITLTLESNESYSVALMLGCVCLLQVLIFLIAYVIIMLNKLSSKKRVFHEFEQEIDAHRVLISFIE